MKNKFFKTLAIFGLSLIAWNCSEDLASTPQGSEAIVTPKPALEVDQSCWMIATGTQTFLIVPNGTGTYLVTNENSIPVGSFDVATNTIIDANGNAIVANVNLPTLPIVNPDKTITYPDGSKSDLLGNKISDGIVALSSSSAAIPGPGIIVSSSSFTPTNPTVSSSSAKTPNPVASSSSQKGTKPASSSSQQQPKSSSAKSDKQCNGQCYDSASGKCVGYHEQQTGSKGEKYAYNESCNLNCYYDPNNQNCQNMTGAAPASSSSQQKPKSSSSVKSSSSTQQPKSSSSQPKSSSSSAPKSSSSSQKQNNPNASAEEAQYLNAGAGGQEGFATRYWDCCMPHCSWPEHGGSAKTCDAKGKTPIGNTSGSICSGGAGATCTSQIPIIVSDKLAYAFAATPGNDNTCGKCFALTFTGKGKYETKANHKALVGKTLVVMASNIGYDVAGNQFDIMIPGGGVGAFNGCAGMGWGAQGKQYGGLLSDCEAEVGYDGDLLTKRKECLTKKCNSAFANDAQAKEGCLFLATWMEAAGNPTHNFKEVPCPAALKAQY